MAYSGLLEGVGVGTARGGVDVGRERTSTVLVDLVEGHGDGALIVGGWETSSLTLARRGSDSILRSALRSLGTLAGSSARSATTEKATESTACATCTTCTTCTTGSVTTGTTAKEAIKEAAPENAVALLLSSGDGGRGCSAHEGGDDLGSVDGTARLGASESGGLAAAHLLRADDGGVLFGAAGWRGTVARSTVSDGETWHVYAIGTLHGCDDTVSGD